MKDEWVRIDGRTQHQIFEAAKIMNIYVKRTYRKHSEDGYYGYGNSNFDVPVKKEEAC